MTPEKPGQATSQRRLLLLAPSLVLLASVLLPPGWQSPLPLCAVKMLTGLDCPGCGMTRAFLLIGHGRLIAAAGMHPAGIPAFLIVTGMALTGLVRIFRSRPVESTREEPSCTAAPAANRSRPN